MTYEEARWTPRRRQYGVVDGGGKGVKEVMRIGAPLMAIRRWYSWYHASRACL